MLAHTRLSKDKRSPAPVRWHIDELDKVTIGGVAFRCIAIDHNGYRFERLDAPDVILPLTIAQFDALRSGEFSLERRGLSAANAQARLQSGSNSLSDLHDDEKRTVQFKLAAVKKFLKMEEAQLTSRYRQRAGEAIDKIRFELAKEAQDKAGKGRNRVISTGYIPGPKRFLEWVKDYESKGVSGLKYGYDRCGNRNDRFTEEELSILNDHVDQYLTPEQKSISMIWDDMVLAFKTANLERTRKGLHLIRCPSKEKLRTEIEKLPAFDVMAARTTVETAQRSFHPNTGGVPDLVRPLQRVEADDWTVDLHTLTLQTGLWEYISPELQENAIKTRVTFSASMCCTTRVIPASTISFGPKTSNTKQLLRMTMSDKSELARTVGCITPWEYRGRPHEWVVDEGAALTNAVTEMLCTDLHIGFKSPQAKTPQQRGKIERFFKTLNIQAIMRFSGRAFSSVEERANYEAAARACLTVEELATLIIRFIVDQYHNRPHKGLGGETPRACWLRLTKEMPPLVAPGRAEIRRAFGEEFFVDLHSSGFELFSNWYWSPKTADAFTKQPNVKYRIRVDPEDLGEISVWIDGGWENASTHSFMNGVSLQEWHEAEADIRRQHKHTAEIAMSIVYASIAFQQKADRLARERLSILYQPPTRDQIEKHRQRMLRPLTYRDDARKNPAGSIDIFAKAIPVSTNPVTQPIAPEAPKPAAKTRDIKKPRPVKSAVGNATVPATKSPSEIVSGPAPKWIIKSR